MIALALLLAQPVTTVVPIQEETVDCETTRDAAEQAACAVAEAAAQAAVDRELGLEDRSQPLTPELAEQRARATVREAVRLFCADPQGEEHVNRCAELDVETADMDLQEQWSATLAIMESAEADALANDSNSRIDLVATMRAEQTAWQSFVDAKCQFQAEWHGPAQGREKVTSRCLADAFRQRIQRLADLQQEYDNERQ